MTHETYKSYKSFFKFHNAFSEVQRLNSQSYLSLPDDQQEMQDTDTQPMSPLSPSDKEINVLLQAREEASRAAETARKLSTQSLQHHEIEKELALGKDKIAQRQELGLEARYAMTTTTRAIPGPISSVEQQMGEVRRTGQDVRKRSVRLQQDEEGMDVDNDDGYVKVRHVDFAEHKENLGPHASRDVKETGFQPKDLTPHLEKIKSPKSAMKDKRSKFSHQRQLLAICLKTDTMSPETSPTGSLEEMAYGDLLSKGPKRAKTLPTGVDEEDLRKEVMKSKRAMLKKTKSQDIPDSRSGSGKPPTSPPHRSILSPKFKFSRKKKIPVALSRKNTSCAQTANSTVLAPRR